MDTFSAVMVDIMLILFIIFIGIAVSMEMTWAELTAHIKKLFNFLKKPFRHKTEFEKEIVKTQKEINILKKQKADIEQLRELREEERELFKEVEVEQEITENTKLDHLIEVAKGDLIHTYEHRATINELLDEDSKVFYTLINGELVKIWERE